MQSKKTKWSNFEKVAQVKLGEIYYVEFASKGVEGRCISIDQKNGYVTLESSESRKLWPHQVKLDRLYQLKGVNNAK